jgi:hypothetical protein
MLGNQLPSGGFCPALTASRNCFASACKSLHPMVPFLSTSGRNSQNVSP